MDGDVGHWNDLDCSHLWLYNLLTRDDECLFRADSLCIDGQPDTHRSSSTVMDCTPAIFHHEGLHVGIVGMRMLSDVVALTFQRNLAQRFWTFMSSVSRNHLVGFTRVCGHTTGDFFSLLCLVLLIDSLLHYIDYIYGQSQSTTAIKENKIQILFNLYYVKVDFCIATHRYLLQIHWLGFECTLMIHSQN